MTSRPGSSDEATDRVGQERPGLGSRRVVWTAFGISALVHLAVIVVYPLIFEDLDPVVPAFFPAETAPPPRGLQVIELVELDPVDEAEEPEEPEEIEEIEQPAAEAPSTELEPVDGIEVVPYVGLAERLRPYLQDERLWREVPPEFFELTLEQREELIVADRLSEWLDSVNAGIAAEEALTDWTVTDGDGRRWGVSPGRLHLGDITLPLPINFGTPVGKRDETRALEWQWEEVMRQAARADVEMTWRERAEAIRARRDRERANSPPDTTRSR
jgi:hypothetical protein